MSLSWSIFRATARSEDTLHPRLYFLADRYTNAVRDGAHSFLCGFVAGAPQNPYPIVGDVLYQPHESLFYIDR